MYHSQVNIRYAKSLFLWAEENKKLNEVKKDIDFILQWIEDNKESEFFLAHPAMKVSKKTEIFNAIFEKQVSAYTLTFLHLVVKKKREKHLKYICNDFITIYKKSKGIKTAELTTAFVLSRTHEESIKKSIEEIFKSPVELNTKVDESIIGGLVIQVDDKQLDLSVTHQIQDLKNRFLNIDFNNKKRK